VREYTLFIHKIIQDAPMQPEGGCEDLLSGAVMSQLTYLQGYPENLLSQVRTLIAEQRLGAVLQKRYPEGHDVNNDKALYQYTQDLKTRYLRGAAPVNKVMYDSKIHVLNNALGLHTAISRVQGGKLKAKAEIRVATVFRDAPEAFLRMIVVHELAHLKEEHNKAFYQLCCYMEPQYHQLEFDTRLWLTHLSLNRSA
jgi:predicted metal-dependent hydrolase